jgi:hypothetical protein
LMGNETRKTGNRSGLLMGCLLNFKKNNKK